MVFGHRRRVRRSSDGTYRIDVPERERTMVGELVEQLRSLLLETTDDPSVRRLFPTAYNEDPDRDREYQQLVRDELLERRLAALATVSDTLLAPELTEEEISAWVSAVNDLRLVIGTRLDVAEELPSHILDGSADPDDPEVVAYAVYEYLGVLLSDAVDALAAGLPPDPEI